MSQSLSLYLTVAVLATLLSKQYTIAQDDTIVFSQTNERVITNLETIYSAHGVPLDYSYNETTSNTLTSVPGCPRSIEGLPRIYYGNPKRCYLAQHIDPCGIGEKLLAQNESLYGICGCECMTLDPERYSNLRNSKERYLYFEDDTGEFPYGQIFDTKERKCYGKYERGPRVKPRYVIAGIFDDKRTCLPLCIEKDPHLPKETCTVKKN